METVSELDQTVVDIKQHEVLQGSLGKRLQVFWPSLQCDVRARTLFVPMVNYAAYFQDVRCWKNKGR